MEDSYGQFVWEMARLFHIMLKKNCLLSYSPMLLNVAYYAIDPYPLFHIMLYKNLLYKTKFMLQSTQF